MAIRGGLTSRDAAKPDLSRRIVVRGKIGVAGPVPKTSLTLAAAVGLPHKEAWTSSLYPRRDGFAFSTDGAAVWPLRDRAAVDSLVADLKTQGVKPAKIAELETYLIKQIRSPVGMVVAARPSRLRRASSVMSLFREVEVDDDGAVSYHVHVEEFIDRSPRRLAAHALHAAFTGQAEADLAAIAHCLKRAGRERPVALVVESNNEDTHAVVDLFTRMLDDAAQAIRRNPEFEKATRGIEMAPADGYAW